MENENDLTLQSQTLAKQNVTEQVLARLEREYSGLTISGINDKEGIATVRAARLDCKNTRVLAGKICKAGREEAIEEQRRWLSAEKAVVSRIEAVEKPLQAEEDRIAVELERIKKEQAEAEGRRIAARISEMAAFGFTLCYGDARGLSEEAYQGRLNEAKTTYAELQRIAAEEAEKRRIADELAAAEMAEAKRVADEKAAKVAAEQAEIAKKLAAQQAEIDRVRAEMEARERALHAAENAQQRKEEKIAAEKRHAEEVAAAKKQAMAEALKLAEEAVKQKELRLLAEKEAERIKASQAPDKEKLFVLARTISALKLPEMDTRKGIDIISDVNGLMGKVVSFINKKAEEL